VTEVRFFHLQAESCRLEAEAATDPARRQELEELADAYDEEARRLNLEEVEG
jgi:hypothetical protein